MLTKIIEEDRLQKAQALIEKGEKFVIVTHVSPDGDAIGSSLGMLHFLHALGKENVSVIVPNEFPTFYHWMPGASEILIHEYHSEQCETLLKEADVLFCLDFNEPKRIEKLAPAVVASPAHKILIDHHLAPSDFCEVMMSFPSEVLILAIAGMLGPGLGNGVIASLIATWPWYPRRVRSLVM